MAQIVSTTRCAICFCFAVFCQNKLNKIIMDSQALRTIEDTYQEHPVGGNYIINPKCFQSLAFSCLHCIDFLFTPRKYKLPVPFREIMLATWSPVGACYFVHLDCCDNFMSYTWKQVVMSQVHSKLFFPFLFSLCSSLSFSFFSCPAFFFPPSV